MNCMARFVHAKSTARNNDNPRYNVNGTTNALAVALLKLSFVDARLVDDDNDTTEAVDADRDNAFVLVLERDCCVLYTYVLRMYARKVYPLNWTTARNSPNLRLHSCTDNSSCKYPYNNVKKKTPDAHTTNCAPLDK